MVHAIDVTPATVIGPVTSVVSLHGPGEARWRGVSISPVDLHRRSGIDRDTYATARCIASEVRGTGEALLAVAEAIRNAAKEKGTTPYTLLAYRTAAAYSWTAGRYGEQHGRWASTRQDPTQRTLAAARAALQQGANIANGAARWLGLATMDAGSQGDRKLTYDAIGIAKKWGAEGWQWIGHLPRVDTYRTVALFRRVSGKVGNDDLCAVIELARGGKSVVGRDAYEESAVRVAETGLPAWMLAAATVAVATL
jgi:hypothetical protein